MKTVICTNPAHARDLFGKCIECDKQKTSKYMCSHDDSSWCTEVCYRDWPEKLAQFKRRQKKGVDEQIMKSGEKKCACPHSATQCYDSVNRLDCFCKCHAREDFMDGQTLKSGAKKDEGKARWDLLPYEVLDAVARILTIGAKKYDARNWEKGISYGKIFGAAQRHLAAFWNGPLNGTDGINRSDGLESHIDHAICELMFLSAYEKRGMKAFDDRPKPNKIS